jgi:hypothetical protein
MSATTGSDWNAQDDGRTARRPYTSLLEGTPMREKLTAIRDTMIVLGMQVVFRTVMLLRRWNY